MSDLRSRVDAWLDADLTPAAPRDEALAVAAALARARRLRARRRAVAAGSIAAVAAGVAAVLAVGGLPALTTQPVPPSGPTPSRGPLDAWRDARPLAVEYPGGTVTWPAPANGWAWTVPGKDYARGDALARLVRDDVREAFGFGSTVLPPDDGTPEEDRGVVARTIDGEVTSYEVAFDLADGDRRGRVEVLVTRGGAEPGLWDRCGRWPADAVGPLGTTAPDSTDGCSLVSATVDDEPVPVVRDAAPLTAGGTVEARTVFTVRPDGTAVRVRVVAATNTSQDPPGLRELPPWDSLEALAVSVQWPTSLPAEASPLDVVYPDGAGGTTTVRWPAPANGRGWTHSGNVEAPADATAAALEASVRAEFGGSARLETPSDGRKLVVATLDGRPTYYAVRLDVVVGDRAGRVEVRLTPGGKPQLSALQDPCGTWPAGVPRLGSTEAVDDPSCSLGTVPDLRGADIRVVRSGIAETDPVGWTRSVFTVRSDGVAVQVVAQASTGDAGRLPLTALPDWPVLESLAAGLDLPGGVGR